MRSSIERLAECAPVASSEYEATAAALKAHARKTVRAVTKTIATRYVSEPRRLDAIGPGLSALSVYDLVPALARRMKAARQARPPRWCGFGGEGPLINLRGAALYARYERRKAWRRRRKI